ncbi:MAG: DUF2029 domain-containing protein [Anaerolineae bacterium]|nr:DUF2029 domain-containing protein [Anaerolineae bacterium]
MEAKDAQERQKYIVLSLVGMLYSFGIAYLFINLPGQRFTDDFFPRWYASKMLLTTGRSLYDWNNASELVGIVGWPLADQLGYYYPAYLLLFTGPLALIPYEAARFIWTVLGLWSVWLAIVILVRLLMPGLSVNRLTVLLVLSTISVPVLQHTLNAQFNAVGVLALALTYLALHRQKYLGAGMWAGGMLFKPQAILLPLGCLLIWTILKSERRRFWLGLGITGLMLWGLAELWEPNWVTTFLSTLQRYQSTRSVLDVFVWNPYQLVSLTLLALTLWLTIRLRNIPATSPIFAGLMAWAISVNALMVPLYGMLHMVMVGGLAVLLLSGCYQLYPHLVPWVWGGVIGLFGAGLLAFIGPMLFAGASGLQITISEYVYKLTMPTLSGLGALFLIFNFRTGKLND